MLKNITGKKFGRWIVIKPTRPIKRSWSWLCKCECGIIREVAGNSLRLKKSQSCGCLQKEIVSKTRHGHARHIGSGPSPTYRTWQRMRARCNNLNDSNYKHYGGRGIKINKKWNKFEHFLNDMGERPQNMTIDRINNNGNYCKKNCKWSTINEQLRNKRNTHFVSFNGKTLCVADWEKIIHIPRKKLYYRLNKGWTIKRAFTS